MTSSYDAIVVGARCAGSPTAMLLARKGYKVLLVDRATFPSDTVSTHIVHPPGMAALSRWGLRDALVATGCPSLSQYSLDFGPVTIAGSPHASDGVTEAYCPRRYVLDTLLVNAAADAGADVRTGFSVDDVVIEDGQVTGIRGRSSDGKTVTERARVVIGADGRHSRVARAVQPEQYNERSKFQMTYYSYWSGVPQDSFEGYVRPQRGFGAVPTHDDLTIVIAMWPYAEAEASKRDTEGKFLETLELVPEFAERVRSGRREERFSSGANLNVFRKPFGDGWALVGDAGYEKDPITAQGISDAFRDAELCVTALDEWFTGARPCDEAMADYQQRRDREVLPLYEFTCELATLEPPPPEMQQLLGAMSGNKDAMDGFISVFAGTVSPADFFAPANVDRIIAAA